MSGTEMRGKIGFNLKSSSISRLLGDKADSLISAYWYDGEVNPHLKAFFEDKNAQLAWAEFILDNLNSEVLERTYSGKSVVGYKEAKDIIAASFRELEELFTPKKPRHGGSRAE